MLAVVVLLPVASTPCLAGECCCLVFKLVRLLAGFVLLASTPCLTVECSCLVPWVAQLPAGLCCGLLSRVAQMLASTPCITVV